MLIRKGKLIFDSLKSRSIINSIRLYTLPQSADKPDAPSPVSKVKRKKKPLMKNVFVGTVDSDYLHFPSKKNVQLPNALLEFCQHVKNKEKTDDPYNALKKLAKTGFYGHIFSTTLESVTYTDLLHLLEELDLDAALSLLLEIHSSFIIPTISLYGSIEQKEKYLKRIYTGEVTGAIAISEESGGCDPSSINMIAREETDGSFTLEGEKNWVTNGLNADFFVVLAKVPVDNLRIGSEVVNELSAFIVDKNSNIMLQKHDSSVLNDCNIAKVILKNHSLPSDSIVGSFGKGYDIAKEGLKNPKFISAICILNNLKRVISDVTKHINSRKQFPRNLRENELVQLKLCKIVGTVYSLESMLYLTADILDKYATDTSLESALIQIYAFEQGMNALFLCMELLGSKVYDKALHYEALCRDLMGLSSFTDTNLTKLFVALHGLEYAGNHLKNIVKQNRNPLNYPLYTVKKILTNNQFVKDKVKLSLHLYEDFHPSLKESAEQLEYCILRFGYVIEVLFSRYGADLAHRTIDLTRLADISLEIFSQISILSRSSHSYCTGIMNCDQEVTLARKMNYEAFVRVKKIMDDIMSFDIKTSDTINIEIGSYLLSKQNYFIEHPLKHDI